jgi:putative endonuclease|tara:strand:+ start:1034 stop:1327 length:294 start_codon:yes stop_codon:yes gene_type:complete
MSNTYYVYMLASAPRGTLYVGVTNDIVRRVYEHRIGAVEGFTKQHNVKLLVWFDTTPNIESAIQHEKRLKRWRRDWKFGLVEKNNPEWRDLYDDISR